MGKNRKKRWWQSAASPTRVSQAKSKTLTVKPKKFAIAAKPSWFKKLGVLHVSVTRDVFFTMLSHFISSSDEVACYLVVDEKTDAIIWADAATVQMQNRAFVKSNTAGSVVRALQAGHAVPNGLAHTHPFGSAFHSSTDVHTEIETVVNRAKTGDGKFYFPIVADFNWIVRTYEMKDGKVIGYYDGHVVVDDIKLENPVPMTTIYDSRGTTAAKPLAPKTSNNSNGHSSRSKKWDDPTYMDWWEGKLAQMEAKETGKIVEDEYASFFGNWSDKRKDYDRLFFLFDVETHNFPALYNTIEKVFPNQYFDIMDDRELWPIIAETLGKEESNDDRHSNNVALVKTGRDSQVPIRL